MRRTGWRKTPDLAEQMEWQHAGEPPVMTWTAKAIDRSVAFWTAFFSPLLAIPFIAFVVSLIYEVSLLAWLSIFCMLFVLFLYVKVGLEKTVFVYRATNEHLEICQWQDIPDMVFTILQIYPFVIVGIILMLFISDPGLSITALAGPVLLGFMMTSFSGESTYKKIYKDFQQYDYRWDEAFDPILDTRHGLIRLDWPYELPPEVAAQVENPEQYNKQCALLYFRKDQQDQVVQLVKSKLPQGICLGLGLHKYCFSG